MAGRDEKTGRTRPGPIFDDSFKVLAEDDLSVVLSLLGVEGSGARHLNVELAGSAIRADLVARIPTGIVHVEFVKDSSPLFDLRMVDYRFRLRRLDRRSPIRQFVLALNDAAVPSAYVDPDAEGMRCSWTIVRIPDLDPDALLASPTTAPLAPLTRGTPASRATYLTWGAELIAASVDPDRAERLIGAAMTFASSILPRRTVVTALKEAAMPFPVRESPLGRELYEEGWHDGRQEAVVAMTAVLLRQRFGDDARIPDVASRFAELPVAERVAQITAAATLDDLTGR